MTTEDWMRRTQRGVRPFALVVSLVATAAGHASAAPERSLIERTLYRYDNQTTQTGAASTRASYEARWFALDNMSGSEREVGGSIAIAESRVRVPDAAWGPPDDAGDRYAVVAIRTVHPDFASWQQPLRVTIRDRRGSLGVVGIERPR